ncbi:MAG: Zn-ribbon domain-containing protein [Candidatus Woesearchaeota archaeon]
MPHQCVRCGTVYDDGSKAILSGCSCGAKLFFFVKKKNIEEAKEAVENLTTKDKKQIEKDVLDIVGVKEENDNAVILDFESIRILKPGKFEVDLVSLFKKDKPLVYKLEEGKYVIDLAQSFLKKE